LTCVILNYVQQIFPGGAKIFLGGANPPYPPGYGPGEAPFPTVTRKNGKALSRKWRYWRSKTGVTNLFAIAGRFVSYRWVSGPHNFFVLLWNLLKTRKNCSST